MKQGGEGNSTLLCNGGRRAEACVTELYQRGGGGVKNGETGVT